MPAVQTWQLTTPDGRTYGPVCLADLERWIHEGRVTADCRIMSSNSDQWLPAGDCYPVLQAPSPAEGGNPFAAEWTGPSATPEVVAEPGKRTYSIPHRGPIVLGLGITGWFLWFCPLLCVCAWLLGNIDLREMRAGRMDPAGAGMTQAGRVLGMILTIVWIIAFGIGLTAALMAVAL